MQTLSAANEFLNLISKAVAFIIYSDYACLVAFSCGADIRPWWISFDIVVKFESLSGMAVDWLKQAGRR